MHILAYFKAETDRKPVSRRRVSVTVGSVLIMTLLLFAGCTDRDDADSGANKAPTPGSSPATSTEVSKGLIKADPNPVSAGSAPLGKTKISWNTQSDVLPVTISVSSNGEPEVPFAGGEKEGATEAPWIQAGAAYDFRLYVGTGANRKMIDHVTVTRSVK